MHDILEEIRLNLRPRHVMIAVLALALAGVVIPGAVTPGSGSQTISSSTLAPPPTPTPIVDSISPSRYWVNAYSTYSVVGGTPVAPGAIIRAYDPQGVLIGKETVANAGSYGLMTLYGDDPSTATDEGATPGDRLSFTIDGQPALAMGPDAPHWSSDGGLIQIDLLVN